MSVFAVSKVRTNGEGYVTAVFWGVVDTKSNRWVSPEVEAPVVEVLDAIHNGDQVVALFPATHGHLPERQFVVMEHAGGQMSIALDGPPTPAREIQDMDQLGL
ncbi:MAG: hypothetical protein H7274_04555 [Rhodoferax sp.]|nr:hypothetical protein [Rhodoferax sp.]